MNSFLSSNKRIYLDASATTPPRGEVNRLIYQIQSNNWANPSSLHYEGLQSAELLERSRIQISKLVKAKTKEIVFTSGATESVNIALLRSAQKLGPGRLVISSVEHPCVYSVAKKLKSLGWEIFEWPVDKYGVIDLNLIDQILSPPTKIVSLIWGQSEIGTIQPISKVGVACKERNILFHVDASQYLPNKLFDWDQINVDFLSASAHKFQGPKGVGLLLVRNNQLPKLIYASKYLMQESGVRSGTEPVALIAGMSLALNILYNSKVVDSNNRSQESITVSKRTNDLRKKLSEIPGIIFTGHPINRLSNHISMLVGTRFGEPLDGRLIVRNLSEYGISASNGTACKSGNLEGSDILRSIHIDEHWLTSGLRFSLGPWISSSDIEYIPQALQEVITQLSKGM